MGKNPYIEKCLLHMADTRYKQRNDASVVSLLPGRIDGYREWDDLGLSIGTDRGGLIVTLPDFFQRLGLIETLRYGAKHSCVHYFAFATHLDFQLHEARYLSRQDHGFRRRWYFPRAPDIKPKFVFQTHSFDLI